MTHTLTITDLSSDSRDETHLLFATPEGAKGYAARRGDMGGYLRYALDGFSFTGGDPALARDPVGYRLHGVTHVYAEAV